MKNSQDTVLVLRNSETTGLVSMTESIQLLKEAYTDLGKNRAQVLNRRRMHVPLDSDGTPNAAPTWFQMNVIPGAVPFILTGVRQAVALGLIGVVVGEMFGGSEGIGYMVNYGGQTFQTDTVFLGVTIIALSGIILTWLAERLEKRFSRWRPER